MGTLWWHVCVVRVCARLRHGTCIAHAAITHIFRVRQDSLVASAANRVKPANFGEADYKSAKNLFDSSLRAYDDDMLAATAEFETAEKHMFTPAALGKVCAYAGAASACAFLPVYCLVGLSNTVCLPV